jgi:hypothetical protein
VGGGTDVPKPDAKKVYAIESNPNYKPEQKAAYKQQVEENKRAKALLEKRSK